MQTQTPQLALQTPQRPRAKRPCKYCPKSANRPGKLCHQHHLMWPQGHQGIVPDTARRSIKPPALCSQCNSLAHAKGLCPKHYSRMRRAASRPKCTLPYCQQPREPGNNLFCPAHAGCIAPGCERRFKARRLCANHYRTLYLAPRDRTFLENLAAQNGPQPQLFPNTPQRRENQMAFQDHSPFLLTQDAPPLHAQAGCRPEQAHDIQVCLDALHLLKSMGILSRNDVLKAQAKASRILSNRLAKAASKAETTA